MGAAELAIVDARVRTGDPARPAAQAVAFRAGSILAVGDNEAIRACCDAATTVVSVGGAAVTPGITDAHMHPLWAAEVAVGADCSRCRTVDELRAVLLDERAAVGPDGLVRAWGVDYAHFGDGLAGTTLEQLAGGDAFVTFFDLHTHLATPRVLAHAGITGPREFPDSSQVVCSDGVPTGELREFGAYELVLASLPPAPAGELRERVVTALARLNAAGLTGAHVMDGSPETFQTLRELEAEGRLTLRLVVPLWIKPEHDDAQLAELARLAHEHGDLWRGGVAKFFIDGVVETGTAWLEEPDTRGGGTRPAWPDVARYGNAVARFAAAGFQCVTHAIGDRAVRATLDAYAAAGAAPGVRHRLEHAETLPARELPRFAAESVVCSMQPLHMQWRRTDGSDEWTVRLGPERAARAFRVRDVLATGAVVALGSDWPVASFDPREGMAWARLRRRPGDTDAPPFEPHQRLTGEEALAGYTAGAAAAVGRGHAEGRIAPGFVGDVTVFAEDPVDCAADDLLDLPVRLTVVGGRVVFAEERP